MKTLGLTGLVSLSLFALGSAAEGPRLTVQRGHSANCIALSPDETLLCSGGNDGTAVLRDMRTGKQLRTLRRHSGAVQCIAFSPGGSLVATGSDDNRVCVWDVRTGGLRREFIGRKPGEHWHQKEVHPAEASPGLK